MKKKMLPVLIVAGLLLLMAQQAFTDGEPMGKAVIDITAGNKGNVTFPHHTHQIVLGDCTACHNLFPQKAGAIQLMITERKLTQKQVMNQCLACHRDKGKAGVKTGPTSCSKCHKS